MFQISHLSSDTYLLIHRSVYQDKITFYTCYNCVTQDKNLTALTELSAITAAFVSRVGRGKKPMWGKRPMPLNTVIT